MPQAWIAPSLAIAATLAGAAALHRAAPAQRLYAPAVRPAAWRLAGAALLLAGAGLWCRLLQPAAGCSTWLTLAMAAWAALPCIDAWRQARRAREGGHGPR